ncbi:hypothetical protein M422DRAFT_139507, partial [Sphaerobolus stellatus SS14]
VLDLYKRDDHKRFRRNLWYLPLTFNLLVTTIEDHHIFENRSNTPQMPVQYQLAITMFRFGHFGNATSVESVAQ